MMRIRKVRVAVAHGQMAMNVLVRHTRHDRAVVLMLMVRIVNMLVGVFQGFMRVLVGMVFRQVQPDTPRHQGRRHEQLHRDRLVEKQHRHQCTKERRHREIGPCARRTQMPQRQDEQGQAGAVAEKPEQASRFGARLGNLLEDVRTLLQSRKQQMPEGSYSTYLFKAGIDKILKKLGEEATETIIAAKDAQRSGNHADLIYETADLWFHTLVMLSHLGEDYRAVLKELARRFDLSGLDEQASRTDS